jgi:hypothetical protein
MLVNTTAANMLIGELQWLRHVLIIQHNVSTATQNGGKNMLIAAVKTTPAVPGMKQFAGQTATACNHWSPSPPCELTQEDWQPVLAAPVIHPGHHGPTMPALSDVVFEPLPPYDLGVLQSEDLAVNMPRLGLCSQEHGGCDLHDIKGMTRQAPIIKKVKVVQCA